MANDSQRAVTLDELVALSDEIAALARAGIPLASGLRTAARDLPGRVGKLADKLGAGLEEGQSLIDVLRREANFPPAFRAVAEAGIRSGRLAVALEGVATTSRRAREIRRLTVVSMIYPLIVLAVGTGLLSFSLIKTTPPMLRTLEEFQLSVPSWYRFQVAFGEILLVALPFVWVALLVFLIVWYVRSRQAASFSRSGLGFLTAPSRLVVEGQLATFHDVLALLIDQHVPLVEGIPLAGAASGNARIARGAETLASQIARGERPTQYPEGIPPLLGWMLTTNVESSALVSLLKRGADSHRERVSELVPWVGVYIPVFVSAGIGGAVTCYYVLLVLAPFYSLLRTLALA